MVVTRIIAILVSVALGLPITILVLLGVGWLLGSMGDHTWASVLSHISTALSLVWILDLLGLVICLGVNACCGKPPQSPPS